jgi:hypothetical protein
MIANIIQAPKSGHPNVSVRAMETCADTRAKADLISSIAKGSLAFDHIGFH